MGGVTLRRVGCASVAQYIRAAIHLLSQSKLVQLSLHAILRFSVHLIISLCSESGNGKLIELEVCLLNVHKFLVRFAQVNERVED